MITAKTTPEQNKALVLEAFDTLFNKRDYNAASHSLVGELHPAQRAHPTVPRRMFSGACPACYAWNRMGPWGCSAPFRRSFVVRVASSRRKASVLAGGADASSGPSGLAV